MSETIMELETRFGKLFISTPINARDRKSIILTTSISNYIQLDPDQTLQLIDVLWQRLNRES